MDKELRMLILEDSPADAELEEHELRKSGLVFTLKVVDTEETFVRDLDEFFPDIILSDYDVPAFDGLAALRIAKEKCPDVPFILVTGKLGEEFAIETLKEGATDYVLKGNLKRLVPSVNRALEEAKQISKRKRAEEALQESENKFRSFAEQALVGIYLIQDGVFKYINSKFAQMFGYTVEECLNEMPFKNLVFAEDLTKVEEQVRRRTSGEVQFVHYTFRGLKKNGVIFYVEIYGSTCVYKGKPAATGTILDITERKKTEEALQESEEKFRSLFESSRDALMTLEPPSWAFTSGNPATIAMFRAKDEKDFVSHAPWQLSPERQPDGRASDEKAKEMIETAMHEGSYFFEWTHKRIDGEEFPATVLLTRMELAERRFLQATVRDITLRKQAEESVKRLYHQNELVLSAAGEGILGLDIHGNHTFVNPSAVKMLGYEVNELIGKHSHTIWHHTKADGSPYPDVECPIYTVLKSGSTSHRTDEVFWRKDGTSFPVSYTATPIKEGSNILGAVVTFLDITESKFIEEELKRLAITDTLTGALNRTKFGEIIERETERVKRYNQRLSMILFDIDHFKEVNDRYGHNAGDYILKTIADIVRENIRKIDYFVRWGGEEFVILSSETQLDKAYVLADRIRITIENTKFEHVGRITGSFGVTEFKKEDTGDIFIKRADDAMYEAKKKGRNRVEMSV